MLSPHRASDAIPARKVWQESTRKPLTDEAIGKWRDESGAVGGCALRDRVSPQDGALRLRSRRRRLCIAAPHLPVPRDAPADEGEPMEAQRRDRRRRRSEPNPVAARLTSVQRPSGTGRPSRSSRLRPLGDPDCVFTTAVGASVEPAVLGHDLEPGLGDQLTPALGSSQASARVVSPAGPRTASVRTRRSRSQSARSQMPGSRSSQRPCVSSMSSSPGAKTSNTKRPPGTRSRGLRGRAKPVPVGGQCREGANGDVEPRARLQAGRRGLPAAGRRGARLLRPRRGGDRPPACRARSRRRSPGYPPAPKARPRARFPRRARRPARPPSGPPRRRSRRPRRRFGSTRRRAPRSRRIRSGRGALGRGLEVRQAFLQLVWSVLAIRARRSRTGRPAQDSSETTCVPFPRGSSR